MKDIINVALASDDNYAQHLAVVIASTVLNSRLSGDNFCFYIINDGIGEEKQAKILQTADSFGSKIVFVDTPENLSDVYISGHLSRATYFRLALPDLLPQNVKKIIYLDVDLVVLQDLADMWAVDIAGYGLAATKDLGIMCSSRLCKQKIAAIGWKPEANYFNAGVLVLNIDFWREHNSSQEIIDLILNNSFPHHDQDALNKIFMGKWVEIDEKWDVIPPVFFLFLKVLFSPFKKEAIQAKLNLGILHYAGRYKPWEFEIHEGFNDKYYEYLGQTAFKDVKMPQPGRNMKGKSITRTMWRLRLSNFWAKILG